MKTLSKVLGIGALILGLSGCSNNYYNGTFENYPFEYITGTQLNSNCLSIFSKEKNGGCIEFFDSNKDGRFDSIDLIKVKKGDEIEKFANLETGQKILNSIIDKKE
jgi:hypothetical protein